MHASANHPTFETSSLAEAAIRLCQDHGAATTDALAGLGFTPPAEAETRRSLAALVDRALIRDDTRPADGRAPWDADPDYRALRVARGKEKAADLITDDDRANALIADLWSPAEIAALWSEMFGPPDLDAPARAICRRASQSGERLLRMLDGDAPRPKGRRFEDFLRSELATMTAMLKAGSGRERAA